MGKKAVCSMHCDATWPRDSPFAIGSQFYFLRGCLVKIHQGKVSKEDILFRDVLGFFTAVLFLHCTVLLSLFSFF